MNREERMIKNASKRSFLAYAASIFVIAGLFSIVAIGGSAVSTKRSMVLFGPGQISAQK
jgi:hypothetical protein